jgi:glycosyltransferase involved in cell wall biosynthesis
MSAPTISCICITRNRPSFLKDAITYFRCQTYPSKHLIIAYQGKDSLPPGAGSRSPDISLIELSTELLTLGARRNLAVEVCESEYICIWDDDDWYHPRRLELQMKHLLLHDKPANVLSRLMLFDAVRQETYLSSERYWEGTLLCRRDVFSENIRYGPSDKGEDGDLLSKLKKRDMVSQTSAPYLYTYVYHGNNTWDAQHFGKLFAAGYKLS